MFTNISKQANVLFTLFTLLALPVAGGCAAETGSMDFAETAVERGSLGKADVSGSCGVFGHNPVDFCGGQGDGACFCDDGCLDFGDCCDDFEFFCSVQAEIPTCTQDNQDCGSNHTCVDFPNDGCDPERGDRGCDHACAPVPVPVVSDTTACDNTTLFCAADEDCVAPQIPFCNGEEFDGIVTEECPGTCAPKSFICRTSDNLFCPAGQQCINWVGGACDPHTEDCDGVCVD